MKLVGYRKTSFKPKDSDRDIHGFNLYFLGKDSNVVGETCERVFLSETKSDGYAPNVGDELRVNYNRYGKVDSVELV